MRAPNAGNGMLTAGTFTLREKTSKQGLVGKDEGRSMEGELLTAVVMTA